MQCVVENIGYIYYELSVSQISVTFFSYYMYILLCHFQHYATEEFEDNYYCHYYLNLKIIIIIIIIIRYL